MKTLSQAKHEASRIKGLMAGFGAAMVMMVAVAACGNGIYPASLSDEVGTPSPTVRGDAAPTGIGSMVPNLRLAFDGVGYTGVEILGAANPDGAIVCCGTPINMNGMGVGGTAILHYPDREATVQVYRPKVDGTTDVYTFHPTQTHSKVEGTPPEDESDTSPATWTRWTVK